MTLQEKALAYNRETKGAIETILKELNKGQRKKLLRNPIIKAWLEKYKIPFDE